MDVKQAIEERRSVRKYKAGAPSHQELTEVMEAARLAPTACNKQPFRLLCVTDESTLDVLRSAYEREWLKNASCMIVVIADHSQSWHRGNDGKDHADIDAAIATDHMTLRAAELGLGTCWICNFDAAKVHRDLNLGESEEAVVLLPIGYAADEPKPKVRKSEGEMYKFL
ncbi:MAG: nitroreductase family protein [Marinilabiliaceae bacterium]